MAFFLTDKQKRNIAIIGTAGSGRASVANAICGKEIFPTEKPWKKSGRPAKVDEYQEHLQDKIHYKFALIDADVGEELPMIISKVFKQLQSVNLILFVLKLQPVNGKTRDLFKKAISCLGGVTSTMAVVVTGCELLSKQAKQSVVEELERELNLTSFANKGITCIGLPKAEILRESILSYVENKKRKDIENLKKLSSFAEEQVHCGSLGTIGKCSEDLIELSTGTSQIPRSIAGPPQNFTSRNILIFGKAGAGKSTVANALVGKEEFSIDTSIKSTIRQVNTRPIKTFEWNRCTYKIGIVDTVSVEDDRVPLKSLQERVSASISNFKNLNLILFVFKNERFTSQERDSFHQVIAVLNSNPGASSITAIVMTCCEQKSREAREEMKHELQRSHNQHQIVAFAKKGIHLVGFPKSSELPSATRSYFESEKKKDEEALQHLLAMSQEAVSMQAIVAPPQRKRICN